MATREYTASHEARRPELGHDADRRFRAVANRDSALARVGSARRWIITAAAGLSAGFAALVYALAPGHSLSAAHAATSPRTGEQTPTQPASGQATMPPAAGAGALGLNSGGSGSGGSGAAPPAPAQSAPAPAPAPAPSTGPVSGGS